VAASISMITSD